MREFLHTTCNYLRQLHRPVQIPEQQAIHLLP